MTKNISVVITVAFMILSSSCTTYNSLVPEFATIGSSSTPENTKTKAEMAELKLAYESALTTAIKTNNALTKAKEAYVGNNDDTTWWNPFSWF